MEESYRIRFADAALDEIASVLCGVHAFAPQYIKQAPALVLLACQKFPSNITFGEVDKFSELVATGPKLRTVLDVYSMQKPLAKLSEQSLRTSDKGVIGELLTFQPSMLAQCIPDSADQRLWLDGLKIWTALSPAKKNAKYGLSWVAMRLKEDVSRIELLHSLRDFVQRGGGRINSRWSWQKAIAEVQAWHERLNDERRIEDMIRDAARQAAMERVICKAPLPDRAETDGYEFIVLRTGRALQEEGIALHHCVASYAGAVKRGHCAIVSVRREGVNVATLEIGKDGSPQQIKSHCNAKPEQKVFVAAEAYALRHWNAEGAA